jgi:uncharacterized SAM-binding protein YcdF (DUF218 family)
MLNTSLLLYYIVMAKHDIIVVLGSQPNPKTWKFPRQVYDCLDKAADLFFQGNASYIGLTGKWGLSLEDNGYKQPFFECDAMAEYLYAKHVPADKILCENKSKDTISNLYYLKTTILMPRKMHDILFVVAEFRLQRLKFLCHKVLGPDYKTAFEAISAEASSIYDEPHTFQVQSEFLKPMKPGQHTWLTDKFYTAPMYSYWTKYNKQVIATKL